MAFLYLVVPSLYLCWRRRKNLGRIVYGVLALTILFGIFYEFLATLNNAWQVPNLLIPYRLFGIWPIDQVFSYAAMNLFTIVFYEHFLDTGKHFRLSNHYPQSLSYIILATVAIFAVYLLYPQALIIPYIYAATGLVGVIVVAIFSFLHPRLVAKFATLSFFFVFVYLFIEIVGLHIDGWIFPGQYIGQVSMFGVTFPIEEILFWMMWYPAAIVAYYEYALDDEH